MGFKALLILVIVFVARPSFAAMHLLETPLSECQIALLRKDPELLRELREWRDLNIQNLDAENLTDPQDPQIGDSIGEFHIRHYLGRGTFAAVYEVEAKGQLYILRKYHAHIHDEAIKAELEVMGRISGIAKMELIRWDHASQFAVFKYRALIPAHTVSPFKGMIYELPKRETVLLDLKRSAELKGGTVITHQVGLDINTLEIVVYDPF